MKTAASTMRTLSGLCLGLLAAGVTSARGDHIDRELFNKAHLIMKDLEARAYKNVGILKFQVRKGNAAPTLAAGKLNYLMATRLENALVMKDNPDAPIGLTRGASAAAALKDPQATFLTAEGRQKLFTHKYPLAWGSQEVEVDAFLTGSVEIGADLKKTEVVVTSFDRKNPEFREVLRFAVDTDLSILRDTNQNFLVTRRTFNAWANADNPEEELNKIAIASAVKENEPAAARQLTLAELKEYLDLAIFLGDKQTDVGANGILDTPASGQKAIFKLTAKVRLGVLLRVNGVNTLNEQRDEKADLKDYSWWVLDPNVTYGIRGFYAGGAVKPFEASADADVTPAELGENAERHGKIDLDIFVDPADVVKELPTPKTRTPALSFRTASTGAATFAQLKSQVQKNMVGSAQKLKTRPFLLGGAAEQKVLETTAFDGRHVGGLTIHYAGKKGKTP